MQIISVKVSKNPYNIYVGSNLFKKVPAYIKELQLGNYGIIIISEKVYSIYKKQIDTVFQKSFYKIIPIADGESAKSQKLAFQLLNKILLCDGIGKKIFLVCIGGGTIGDLGGFIASIYKRGISFVQIPTTLLAQIDASIGGKTAINLPTAKNIIGTFYQPKAVFIDSCFLQTLQKKEILEGVAEAIKYAVITDQKFFYFLKTNYRKVIQLESSSINRLIVTCVAIKAKIVEKDETETKGIRTILNFGHTLAHALETSLRYQKISHGYAVALGMIYAGYLSYSLNQCTKEIPCQLFEIIRLYGFPTTISCNSQKLFHVLMYDKKFISGNIRMVLVKRIGIVTVVDNISSQKIIMTLQLFKAYLKRLSALRKECIENV